MEELLKTKLVELAKQKTINEQEDTYLDIPYERGKFDGFILLAREILNTFCIKY